MTTIKKKFGHNITDVCQGCGMEFGDHRAKPPHVSMPPDPPCRGFRPACGGTSPAASGGTGPVAKNDPRYAIS